MLYHTELFLGLELYTDHLPLIQALEQYIAEHATGTVYVEDAVPEIVFTIAQLREELAQRNLKPRFVVYAGHVIQLWPDPVEGKAELPSSARVLFPAGVPGSLEPISYRV